MKLKISICFFSFIITSLFFALDTWAERIILEVRSDTGGEYRTFMNVEEVAGFCEGVSFVYQFSNLTQIDSDHLFVGFDDDEGILKDSVPQISADEGITIYGPAFIAEKQGGKVYLCVDDEFRRSVMLSMAKNGLGGPSSLPDFPDIFPTEVITGVLAKDMILCGFGAGATVPATASVLAIAGAYATAEITEDTVMELLARLISEGYADLADNLIMEHMYLWYTGQITDLSQLDPSYLPGTELPMICKTLQNGTGLCWRPDSSNDLSCENGSGWTWYGYNGNPTNMPDENYCQYIRENQQPVLEDNIGDILNQGTDDPSDPTIYTQDEDSDLHIKDFHLAIYGTDHWEHRVEMQLYPGQSFQIEGKARIENDSGVDADDIDSDYRVDHGKNFDDQDTKLDEDNPFDLDPYEVVTKKMGRTTISLSQDGQIVTVQGPGRSESFDVEDGFCKIYFFVDVENDDDKDISSNSDSDEYGVVEVTVLEPNYNPEGYVDYVTCAEIEGWAKDPDTDDPINIHIYYGDANGNGRTYVASVTADLYRSDVGYHAFSWTVPESLKDGVARTLFFYAINYPVGDNPQIYQTSFLCATNKPVYRFYNRGSNDHFFTASEGEKNSLLASSSWAAEGIAFRASVTRDSETFPIYRFYNVSGEHFYTRSESEKSRLISNTSWGWTYEGVAFYCYASQLSGTVPVYRLYSSSAGRHMFTTSVSERDKCISQLGYSLEGIGWYAYPF